VASSRAHSTASSSEPIPGHEGLVLRGGDALAALRAHRPGRALQVAPLRQRLERVRPRVEPVGRLLRRRGRDQDVARPRLILLPLLHLDHVVAERGQHRLGDLAHGQRERRLVEGRDHLPAAEGAEVAARLAAARVRRLAPRDLGEVRAADDLLPDRARPLQRRRRCPPPSPAFEMVAT
jgi:hypothetical protein